MKLGARFFEAICVFARINNRYPTRVSFGKSERRQLRKWPPTNPDYGDGKTTVGFPGCMLRIVRSPKERQLRVS